jgi:hypothetical protein
MIMRAREAASRKLKVSQLTNYSGIRNEKKWKMWIRFYWNRIQIYYFFLFDQKTEVVEQPEVTEIVDSERENVEKGQLIQNCV